MILGRKDSTSMNTVPMTGKSWQRSNDFSLLWLRYKWYVPLTYIFQGSAQDPKTTWMNVSSDKGLTVYFGLLKWFSTVAKERAFDEESPTKNQDWSYLAPNLLGFRNVGFAIRFSRLRLSSSTIFVTLSEITGKELYNSQGRIHHTGAFWFDLSDLIALFLYEVKIFLLGTDTVGSKYKILAPYFGWPSQPF